MGGILRAPVGGSLFCTRLRRNSHLRSARGVLRRMANLAPPADTLGHRAGQGGAEPGSTKDGDREPASPRRHTLASCFARWERRGSEGVAASPGWRRERERERERRLVRGQASKQASGGARRRGQKRNPARVNWRRTERIRGVEPRWPSERRRVAPGGLGLGLGFRQGCQQSGERRSEEGWGKREGKGRRRGKGGGLVVEGRRARRGTERNGSER
ncbi:hypothetical protein MPTK1_5g20570 [Marchantia polymorpha subsp. ruderalis]|uniref:Uncharacterized protein n=2 Tax=Marchantia polymorpha TaxID=3197 RepID=A0AAF6BKF9_MARPO|nr:hypothetical protein MARPO_0058s0035 [Marchantia polymorpha]BBN12493.1 hypothetical protein Mp_5g20570 [Marchantia polymorpha subsp. ruderalis]|eukprot:PTQ37245.1 hypothetical protein MARPO_0058s0035 [Marchantia polymorpha]